MNLSDMAMPICTYFEQIRKPFKSAFFEAACLNCTQLFIYRKPKAKFWKRIFDTFNSCCNAPFSIKSMTSNYSEVNIFREQQHSIMQLGTLNELLTLQPFAKYGAICSIGGAITDTCLCLRNRFFF